MAESGAHLTDHVLPWVPVRQWVLTVPWRLRFLLARDPELCAAVRRSFLRAVLASYRSRAEAEGIPAGRTGAVCVAQRFGSVLNSNVHFHALVLDGVYTTPSPLSRPRFHPAGELQGEEVRRLIETVRERLLRLLRCRGLLSDEGSTGEPGEPPEETEPGGLFGELAAASIQGRVALGPSAGCSTARLAFAASAPSASSSDAPPLCSEREGFSLQATSE